MRRLWGLRGGLVLAMVTGSVALGVPATATASVSESVQWQGDAAHSGDISGAGVTAPLTAAWQADLGGGINQSVAIDDDRVFALKETPINPSGYGQTEDLVALDISSGAVLWTQSFSIFTEGNPAFVTADNGIVTLSWDGMNGSQSDSFVSAFNETTGQQMWSEMLPEGNDAGGPEPPLLTNGVLYLDGGGGIIHAINDATGASIWQSAEMETANPPVLVGNTVVAAGICQYAFGFNASSGATLWQNGDMYGGGTTATSSDGSLVWSSDSTNCASSQTTSTGTIFNPSTGQITGGFSGYTPAFANGIGVHVVPFGSNGQGDIQAFDTSNDSVLWTIDEPTTSAETAEDGSMPLFVDGSLYIEEPEGELLELNPSTGAVEWQGQVSDPAQHPGEVEASLNGLAAGDGYLIAPTNDGIEAFASAPAAASAPAGSPTAATGTPPTPTTKSPSITRDVLRASSRALVTSTHRAELKLSCRGTSSAGCRGKITLTGTRRVIGHRRVRNQIRQVVRLERLTLATGRYHLRAGARGTLELRLTRIADGLLAASGKRGLRVVVTETATSGNAPRLSITLVAVRR